LTLNTERIPIPACVDQVVAWLAAPLSRRRRNRASCWRTWRCKRGPAQIALRPRTAAIEITVEVDAGRIRLRGIVVDDREKALVKEVLQSLSGVTASTTTCAPWPAGLYRFPSPTEGVGRRK